jgi:hypothetical protein
MSSFFDPVVRNVVENKFLTGEWTLVRTAQETSLTTLQVLKVARDIRYYTAFLGSWAT